MRKVFSVMLVIVAVIFITGCCPKMTPLSSDYFKADPTPLELIGGKVPVTINGTFPAGWFQKNATVRIVPVLRYEGGEVKGTAYDFQGEDVAGNGQTISQKNGANVVMKSTFDYIPAMQNSELYLTFVSEVGDKVVDMPEIKVDYGVNATAALLNPASETPAIAPDNFQKNIKEAHEANILFLIQQAELRSSELKKAELADWKNIVADASGSDKAKVDVEISAYASPDGGYDLNDKLAQKREANTKDYVAKELSKANISAPINARYTAEDWDGFKSLVERSNIQDKDLILRVLSMYKDSEEREREIKNISTVFKTLADEILPQLRRSRLTANVEIVGKSDEELTALAKSNPKSLTVEELLYAASLASTTDQKAAIYQQITQLYPKDARGFNNLGVTDYIKGNLASAEANFAKANQLAGSLPEANLNLGYVALAKGDKAKAEEYFGKAAGVSELGNATGMLAVLNGNYNQAVQSFGSTASNNAALSQILAKDYNKAKTTLDAVASPDATTAYLKAIVGARTNSLDTVVTNLKQAVTLDSSLATKALNDIEFAKYIKDSKFLSALTK